MPSSVIEADIAESNSGLDQSKVSSADQSMSWGKILILGALVYFGWKYRHKILSQF